MIAYMGHHDVVGLEVEMQHLMPVKIIHCRQQLVEELPHMLSLFEIGRILMDKISQCQSVDIFHQDIVIMPFQIAGDVGMVERIAYLKLLLQRLPVPLVDSLLGQQLLFEQQPPVLLHRGAGTGASTRHEVMVLP